VRHFQPFAIGYSAVNALGLGQACRLVYRDEAIIQQETRSWGFNRLRFFDCGATQAFMLASHDLIVLTFRGTQLRCRYDWLTDLKLQLISGCSGNVHRGFSEALDCIWSHVVEELRHTRTQNQALLLTGHSMGAALATLATARLHEIDQVVNGLYTFGSPRVGNRNFAECFNTTFYDRTFRVVNDNDLVTRVPPRSFGFHHVGKLIYFDTTGQLHTDHRYWEKFLEEVQGGIEDFLRPGIDCITDHDMEQYAQVLAMNVEAKQRFRAVAAAR
jgi:triacylglycerol lipase